MYKDIANELLSFIQKSPSCFHAVNTMKDMLLEDGYTELRECEAWTLEKEAVWRITTFRLLHPIRIHQPLRLRKKQC